MWFLYIDRRPNVFADMIFVTLGERSWGTSVIIRPEISG